uniref:protein-tyrosine-phosphatase n=2 Tax=Populus alba TaxID=43335 RepID=A0A4U5NR32_POPAL|nr:hypothetical protein D5086_0000246440 [Populus alba]
MAVKTSEKQDPSPAFLETVDEIMRLYKSLPSRPSIEEVEAAISVIKTVNNEEQARLDDIAELECPQDVPQELFSVLQQARKTVELFQSHEQRKEALYLVEADKMFENFDGLIQRVSLLVSGDNQKEKLISISESVEKTEKESVVSDESLIKKREDGESDKDGFKDLVKSSSTKAAFFSVNSEKLSLMKVAAVIEKSANNGAVVLDLRGKLMDQIEWLPLSLGKLLFITELDLSENRIMALPSTISGLKALTKLDVHSNQVINLPGSFGELINLTDLDLRANRLRSLPASFVKLTKLENLDLSSNQFTQLPETVGSLTSLKILNVDTNELEEVPYTIGSCTSLVELRLDFNELRALPEAIGKLDCLEILALHYNRIRGLPTTMGHLSNLRELDVSFNELESIPENLCFAENLKKLNVANNFADLRSLPRNIGNLELLEELDISDDQIRVLPDSFRLLSKLRVFRAYETPLEIPPRQVAVLGAQAVVQFMADLVNKRDANTQLSKKKKKKGIGHRAFRLQQVSKAKCERSPPTQTRIIMAESSIISDQKVEALAKKGMDRIKKVYVWDMDETLILLKSLLNGTYAQAFNGLKDVQKGIEIGKMWEKHILQICDDLFFYEQVENYNKPFLDAMSQYDDGLDLSNYDFNQDGFSPPSDDVNKKKLAYRHRAIANKYKQGLHNILDQEMINLWEELYNLTDEYTDRWLSSARAFLEQCSGWKEDPTRCLASTDGIINHADAKFEPINVLVTSGSLIPSLVKCLLFRLDNSITHENVYSSWEVGKPQCFQWIKERFNGPNVHFCVIGDGWEECEGAQAMQWPFVKIGMHPGGDHRFPGLTLRTLGYYFAVVYGDPDAENNEDES